MSDSTEQIRRAAQSWDWGRSPRVPKRLPLLDDLRTEPGWTLRLSGWKVLLIQHHLGTFLPLVDALKEDGLEISRTWHVDIPYSTNELVNRTLRRSWSDPHHLPYPYEDPLSDYAEAQQIRVLTSMFHLAETGALDRTLVIDDGAYFARCLLALWRTRAPQTEAFRGTRVVEQTTRGHRFLEAHRAELRRLGIAVVSVARTTTKLNLEAPCVGESVGAAIQRHPLAQDPSRICLIGYGAIGEATLLALQRRYAKAHFVVVEKRSKRRRAASERGVEVLDVLGGTGGFDLVVGCTGTNSFKVEDRHLLAGGAALASASSGAIEFDRTGFIEETKFYPDDEVSSPKLTSRKMGIHSDLTFRFEKGRTAVFLNAGFPVNFDGGVESLPPHMIQATRCLLYAAAGQAMGARPGFRDLSAAIDEQIFSRALQHLEPLQ